MGGPWAKATTLSPTRELAANRPPFVSAGLSVVVVVVAALVPLGCRGHGPERLDDFGWQREAEGDRLAGAAAQPILAREAPFA